MKRWQRPVANCTTDPDTVANELIEVLTFQVSSCEAKWEYLRHSRASLPWANQTPLFATQQLLASQQR